MTYTCIVCKNEKEVTASVSKPRAVCICEPCAAEAVEAYNTLPHRVSEC